MSPSLIITPPRDDSSLHKIRSKSSTNFKTGTKPAVPLVIPRGVLEGSKIDNIRRCLELLDHFTECREGVKCTEGEGCRRTKRVICHQMKCSSPNCSICKQLFSLCELHGQYCKKGSEGCEVPDCPNNPKPRKILNSKLELHENSRINDRKEVIKCLEYALKKSSSTEKREEIAKILEKYPVLAKQILTDIYERKINKTRQTHLKTSDTVGESSKDRNKIKTAHSRPVPGLLSVYVANFKITVVKKVDPL